MLKKQFVFALLLALFFFEPFLLFSKGKKPKDLQEESQPVSETEPAQADASIETSTEATPPQESTTGAYVIEDTEEAPAAAETPAETESVAEELPAETIAEETPREIPEGSKIHVVWIWQETQDCLWNLAKQYYGDPWQWKKIYLANKNWILDPKIIFPKQRIVIPPTP